MGLREEFCLLLRRALSRPTRLRGDPSQRFHLVFLEISRVYTERCQETLGSAPELWADGVLSEKLVWPRGSRLNQVMGRGLKTVSFPALSPRESLGLDPYRVMSGQAELES